MDKQILQPKFEASNHRVDITTRWPRSYALKQGTRAALLAGGWG